MNCPAAGRRPANFHKRNYLLSVNTTDFEKTTIQAHSALLTQTVLARSVVLIVRQLYSRDTRRQFCPPHHWINDKIVLPQDRYQDISFRRSRIRGEH